MENKVVSLKKIARFAGILYFIWIITGLYAMFYLPSQTIVRDDAVATANKILAHELIFRSGIINDILSSIIWVVMVLLFYRMFRPVNERMAQLLVALVIVQIPIAIFMETLNLTSLMLFKGDILKTFDAGQRQDLALLFLKINDYCVFILEAFWGLWLVPLAILIYKSRFMPRFLGVWLIITGIFYLILSFTSILLPQYKDIILKSPLALPAELGEVAFMFWLLLWGTKNNPSTLSTHNETINT
jgi:hypothetical protein